MLAARADRAGDAELGAALGGEHHEDQEDQQDAGDDREAPERREDRHEDVALLVGEPRAPSRLTSCSSRPRAAERRAGPAQDVVRERGAGGLVAAVGHEHVADLALAPEQRLRPGERQQDRAPAPSVPSVVVDDRGDDRGGAIDAGEHT